MENMEEEPPQRPPFWLQPATTKRHRLSTGFLVTMFCMLAIVFLLRVIPSIISYTHQVFRPSSVKRSWDSLNLILILFAVVCGFLSMKDREDLRDQKDHIDDNFNVSMIHGSPLIPNQHYSNWYEYRKDFEDSHVKKLVRASSSYPDLRQDADSWGVDYDHSPRYYDDSYAINHTRRPPRSLRSIGSSRPQRGFGGGGSESALSLPVPPPMPPFYYSKIVKSPRKEYESIGRRGRKSKVHSPPTLKSRPPTPPPPPPPPPALPPPPPHSGQCDETRKKSVTEEILTSIYQQRKKKNKLLRRKSHDNLKELRQTSQPPTPPPPPSSKPHNTFSPKKSKLEKKTKFNSINHQILPNPTNFDSIYETIDGGYESPTIPIPPPPPPPPFKLPPWKFVVDGDYIKINSSPKGSGGDESEFDNDGTTASIAVAGNSTPAMFCPSPDVNSKADDFIARFKATLNLEKINSIKIERMGIGFSPLGPDSSPSPSPHAMAISGSF